MALRLAVVLHLPVMLGLAVALRLVVVLCLLWHFTSPLYLAVSCLGVIRGWRNLHPRERASSLYFACCLAVTLRLVVVLDLPVTLCLAVVLSRCGISPRRCALHYR